MGIHLRDEIAFAAGNGLSKGNGDIVGRTDHQCADGEIYGEPAADLEAQFAWRLLCRLLGHFDLLLERDLAGAHGAEGRIDRHHFGERGRIIQGVGILLVQHDAGVAVDDKGRVARPRGKRAVAGRMIQFQQALDALP